MKKLYFVYKVTNLINGKFYIGAHQTYKIKDNYLGSGKLIRQAIKKYGKENFKREILKFCKDEEEMYNYERVCLEDLWESNECYNLSGGGLGGIHKIPSLESIQKGVKTRLENPRSYSQEERNRISERMKGNKGPQGYKWLTNTKTGESRKVPPEEVNELVETGWEYGRSNGIKLILSLKNKGKTYKVSEEQKLKKSLLLKGRVWVKNLVENKIYFKPKEEVSLLLENKETWVKYNPAKRFPNNKAYEGDIVYKNCRSWHPYKTKMIKLQCEFCKEWFEVRETEYKRKFCKKECRQRGGGYGPKAEKI